LNITLGQIADIHKKHDEAGQDTSESVAFFQVEPIRHFLHEPRCLRKKGIADAEAIAVEHEDACFDFRGLFDAEGDDLAFADSIFNETFR
jgi:hypothetical protein